MDTPVPMAMVPTSLNPMLVQRSVPVPVAKPSQSRTKSQDNEPMDTVLVFNNEKVTPPASTWLVSLQRLMDEVREALRAQPHASDIRLLIFTAAASSQEHERTLIPVPPQFQAEPGSGCQVDRLRRSVADNWPSCRLMLDSPSADEQYADLTTDDVEALYLLHWILVATPSSPTLRRMSGLHLRRLCRVLGLARPTLEPGHLLSISYEKDDQAWRGEPSAKPSYAFLGLPFKYLYRFLATGSLEHPPGVPIRLYAQPETALVHCEELDMPLPAPPQEQQEGQAVEQPSPSPSQSSPAMDKSENPQCWRNSILTSPQRALVICQLPPELDESIAQSPEKHFLEYFVQESVGLRPCYLLLFDESVAAKTMFAWPGRRIEVENTGPSLAQRSRARLLGWARHVGDKWGAFKRALAAL
ncbi:uncharacterized protein LOC108023933 [Drosophila biarmipes]|uniref:uncharacterized protein LOC108023933 n=1 Tax=Drosophila biarmipes TaxID=125945 RepID=UPI0007E796D5|nr:uncharacterized protein LOC108023933 [Drosophila biarmipes]